MLILLYITQVNQAEMGFPEEFLHYVWRFRYFDFFELKTSNGQELKIVHPGFLNKDAGPDFSNAKIILDGILWAGQVEIHLRSSDWIRHRHDLDPAYHNVILHVVYEHDLEISLNKEIQLPVLELKPRISQNLIDKYAGMFLNLTDFPCMNQIKHVDPYIIYSTISRALIERYEEKTEQVLLVLEELHGNWNEVFYRFLARNFGFKVNVLPFELLAKAVPQQVLGKHKDQPLQVEALIFGAAGFLKGHFKESYPASLKTEFRFLQKKYQIQVVEVSLWKFMRMRPQNFPTIRLAQFAALLLQSDHLFSKILNIRSIESARQLFDHLPVHAYWKTHFHFKKEVGMAGANLGKSSIDNILLNTVALFLFAFGKHSANELYTHAALNLLEGLPAETNAITRKYESAGVQIDHAFASQGLLQLKKQYCDQKKCLSCGIGIKLLKLVQLGH